MELSLQHKTALICGGSQGIGKAIAIELASCILLSRNLNTLQQTVNELPVTNDQSHACHAIDFNDVDALKALVSNITQDHTIDILINNTGGPSAGPIETADPLAFHAAFTQHLVCNHILAQAVIPVMKQNGWGRIINVISTSVRIPIDNLGVSNTIRAAVASWSKTMSNELAVHGITVNSLLPGFISTARLEAVAENFAARANIEKTAMQAQMRASVPAKRFGSPAEIAAVAAFVASPAASYLNGICIPVDGGRTGSI